MTRHEDLPYLNHILDSINDIEESVKVLTKDQFSQNKDVKESNIMRIEIIGEAVKNIPKHIQREYQFIPWKQISGTRDKLIHEYFGIDINIDWKILEKDLLELEQKILEIKIDLEKQDKNN